MVKLTFDEPQDQQWTLWRGRCVQETANFIAAVQLGNGDAYQVSDLYKDKEIKKRYYFNDELAGPFWRKCAYCEESLANQDGDIEHFRPKKKVSDQDRRPVPGHNGYYWLAYSWENLLPCCSKCNRLNKWMKAEGIFLVGKQDRFPLEVDSPRVFTHLEDITTERPLLINPLIEDPEIHLSVETKTGIIKWSTERGRACVEMFGLNIRDDLREGRKNAIKIVRVLLSDLANYLEIDDIINARVVILELLKYANGEKRFSLAAKSYLKLFLDENYKTWLEIKLARYNQP